MNQGYRGTATLAALLTVLAFPAIAAETSTRAIMHDAFQSLRYLLGFTPDEERFNRSSERQGARAKLDTLQRAADQLQAHASSKDVGFQLLSGSLVASVNEFSYFFDESRQDEAQYFLVDMIQNCVACHSRLPRARDFPLGQRLFDGLDMGSFSLQDRALLEVAARRFDDALSTWEQLFRDPEVDPVDLDVEGNLLDYLVTAVRVSDDLDRPRNTLERLISRPDVPFFMRHYLRVWADDLRSLAPELKGEATLEKALRLFRLAGVKAIFPGSREQTIYDLLASALLYRYLGDSSQRAGPDLAQAYYTLGVIEARSLERVWPAPKVELHFEAAVRSAPSGPLALKSYANVEEYALEGFGSPETLKRLERLRRLLHIGADKKDASRLRIE